MTTIAPQANKREIPEGIPPELWLDELREVVKRNDLAEIPWTHPFMEYMNPDELARFGAQALGWRDHTGEWPTECAYWWPMRTARRRGEMPHLNDWATFYIDDDNVLHCGFCGARWSGHEDGSPHLEDNRCKLCDRKLVEVTV